MSDRQRVWRDWPELGELDASVATVGVFDGFHRGHVALVEAALVEGRRLGVPTVLVTFEPHPLVVLAPERAPLQLLSVDDRIQQALALGVDGVVVLPFTRELAAQPASDFVEHGLVGRLGIRSLVVGDNFRCGRGGGRRRLPRRVRAPPRLRGERRRPGVPRRAHLLLDGGAPRARRR